MAYIGRDMDVESPQLFRNHWKLDEVEREDGPGMTVEGTIAKFCLLLSLFATSFFVSWHQLYAIYSAESPQAKIHSLLFTLPALQGTWPYTDFRFPLYAWVLFFLFFGGSFLTRRGLVVVAPLCAITQGISFGAFECVLQDRYPGVTLLCGLLVIGLFLGLLIGYWLGLTSIDNSLTVFVAGAVGALVFVYAAVLVLKSFALHVPYLHELSPRVSVGMLVAIGCFCGLLMNTFAEIQKAVEAGVPRWVEWRAAVCLFGSFLILLKIVRRLVLRRSTGQIIWDVVAGAIRSGR